MGKKIIFTESQDQYLKDNYLLFPMIKIGSALNIHYKMVAKRLKELGLVVPPDVQERFKRTHRGINEPSPAPKKYYKPKEKPPKQKKQKMRQKDQSEKKTEPQFKNKVVDYSTKKLVRIDHKTWVYRDR